MLHPDWIEETHCEPVCAVIESMTGARLVHDTLEQEGWDVEIAHALKGAWRRSLAACLVALVLGIVGIRDLRGGCPRIG